MKFLFSQANYFQFIRPDFDARGLIESLRRESEAKFNLVGSPHKIERIEALRVLSAFSMLCDPRLSMRLQRFFEFNAQFSEHEDVRNSCIDALYLSRQVSALQHLCFPGGSHESHLYRDSVLKRLSAELELKC